MNRLALVLLTLIAVSVAQATTRDDTAHDPGHDHSDDTEGGHAGHGQAHDLGHVSIAGATFAVTSYGEIHSGGAAVLGIAAEDGRAPAELRAWIGVRNGRGSVKHLLKADDHGHYHGHLEVPGKLPDDSAVWLEVVTDAGRQRGRVALPADGRVHAAGAGSHDHGQGHDEPADSLGKPRHTH